MKKILLNISFFFFSFLTHAEEQSFSFVSHGNLFRPLVANTFEPRVGLITNMSDNRLRLDIGNSVDLMQYKTSGALYSMGSDFFTFTNLRGEKDFHFPVDAVDYLFGFNFNWKQPADIGMWSARFRISHISAHFVDGHYEGSFGRWLNGRNPQVYSREFIDAVVALEPVAFNNAMRLYVGTTILFHVDPVALAPLSGIFGGEYHRELSSSLIAYLAYQATFLKINEMNIRHQLQLGGKLGEWNGRGLQIFAAYFSGYSIHGEYYDVKEHYAGVGFNIDF